MKISSVKRGSIFNSIEAVKTPLSRHNLSYPTRFDLEMGQLIPFYVQDVNPGTNLMAQSSFFGRMMPTISPIMQDIDLEVRYFYVPNRIVWKNFEDFILRVGNHIHPCIPLDPSYELTKVPYLMDLISGIGNEAMIDENFQNDYVLGIDELPYRAYYKIWNEYFRDENVQEEYDIHFENDGVSFGLDEFQIQYVDWKKDYFTSALPWTQRGDMAQFIADVYLNNQYLNGRKQLLRSSNGDLINGNYNGTSLTTGEHGAVSFMLSPGYGGQGSDNRRGELGVRRFVAGANNDSFQIDNLNTAIIDPNGTFSVGFNINDLRMANAVQRFLERSALAGNRYTEYIMGMFGVHCSDSRLQRPEYLGGGVVPYSVSEVMQNEQAQLDSDGVALSGSTPQGNLAGIGRVNGVFGFDKPMFFPEYGWVIGLCYLRPKAMYMNGVQRRHIIGAVGVNASEGDIPQFESYELYYNPFFEHLGEQAVFNVELFCNKASMNDFGDSLSGRKSWDKNVFGYQSQNAFRKYRNGEIHGEFRDTLKHWTLARSFDNLPGLNDSFLKCNPSKRIFAVEDDSNHFIFEVYNKVDAVLPMSAYGSPAL